MRTGAATTKRRRPRRGPSATSGGQVVSVGVVGCGYWGPNLIRNFAALPGARVAYICDADRTALEPYRWKCPNAKLVTDYRELLEDETLDAVVVATPPSSHYAIASRSLALGKHVLVEKPMTTSVSEGERLVQTAKERGLVLMVDHTFIFTPAVRKIRRLITSGGLGEVLYVDSVRISFGLFQTDVNVMWDLASHDLAIVDFLLDASPRALSCVGIKHTRSGVEDVAYITIWYDNGATAHFHVNWLSPIKIRRMLFGGTRKMLVYDDLVADEKIRIYDKGVTLVRDGESRHPALRVQYRLGDMHVPHLATTEALVNVCGHFLECVRTGSEPITGGESGLKVVRMLHSMERSSRRRGAVIELPPRGAG